MPGEDMLARFEHGQGFLAALDQSGGSTPEALARYGVDETSYSSNAEMYDLIHEARARIITSPVFTSDRVLGAILFEDTIARTVSGLPVSEYLWEQKGILPFLKIDRGLEPVRGGVQLMRHIPDLEATLVRAHARGVFGTKARSVIHAANPIGISRLVAQQFEIAERVLAAGLMPILEPEALLAAPDRAEIEDLLKTELLAGLAGLGDRTVSLKVTIPVVDDHYAELIEHPNVVRVVALSGGYSRDDANARLARNPGLIASFSRALLDGLTAQQTLMEFDRTLEASIQSIYEASVSKGPARGAQEEQS